MTIKIKNADIDISVDEGGSIIDSRWFFKVTRNDTKRAPGEIRSFHVRGLPGDVSDTGEYNDFFAKVDGSGVASWPSPTTNKANASIVWAVFDNGRNPLLVDKKMVTFGFDTDYNIAQTIATGKFEVGIDYKKGSTSVIEWSGVIPKVSVSAIPLPASALLLATGLLGLMRLRKTQALNLGFM